MPAADDYSFHPIASIFPLLEGDELMRRPYPPSERERESGKRCRRLEAARRGASRRPADTAKPTQFIFVPALTPEKV